MGTETMAFFGDLTTLLQQKWLQFFQDNRSWITLQMDVEAVYTPDGGRRPASYFILGVINALEPQLGELMLPFSQLNSNPDALIEVLELNFDPDLFLGNLANTQADILVAALTEEEMADEVVLVMEEDPIMVLTEIEPDEIIESLDEVVLESGIEPGDLSNMSLDEIAIAMGLAGLDEQSLAAPDIAQQEPLETPDVAQPNEEDLLSDVWADPDQADKQKSEQNISRLFPNS